MKTIPIAILLLFWLAVPGKASSQDLSDKANNFLNSLPPAQKAKAIFQFGDPERYNWNFVPLVRKGPTFHDFNPEQKEAALALLKGSLSEQGFNKTGEIRELETVLFQIENNSLKMPDGSPTRDPLNYHFSVFGNPSPTSVWGWRFEGHHISLNFTSAAGKIQSGTPAFLGANPGIVKAELQKGKEVLKNESELGFALVNSLSTKQLNAARFSENAPREIITGNDRQVESVDKKGIAYSALSREQKKIFIQLLDTYIGNYIFEFSESFREKITNAGLDNLYFAWAGGLKEGIPHYYRIHGPTLLIEFDNIQNNANHVHTVIRDLTNDFAEDLLQKHYQKEHHNR